MSIRRMRSSLCAHDFFFMYLQCSCLYKCGDKLNKINKKQTHKETKNEQNDQSKKTLKKQ